MKLESGIKIMLEKGYFGFIVSRSVVGEEWKASKFDVP